MAGCSRCRQPYILRERSPPCDRHREEQGVKAGVVEPFADIAPRRDQNPLLGVGDLFEPPHDRAALLHAHAAAKEEHVPREPAESLGKTLGVVLARGEHERRTTRFERAQHVVEDHVVARHVLGERPVDMLDRWALRLDALGEPKRSQAQQRPVCEGALPGLGLRARPEPHRPHCMNTIGWWPSWRVTVADSPSTYLTLARRATFSKLGADR